MTSIKWILHIFIVRVRPLVCRRPKHIWEIFTALQTHSCRNIARVVFACIKYYILNGCCFIRSFSHILYSFVSALTDAFAFSQFLPLAVQYSNLFSFNSTIQRSNGQFYRIRLIFLLRCSRRWVNGPVDDFSHHSDVKSWHCAMGIHPFWNIDYGPFKYRRI